MPEIHRFKVGQSIRSDSDNFYRTLQLLGAGKNASAYLMLSTSQKRKGTFYALKILHRDADDSSRVAFEQERDLLQQLDHPSILKIVDEGTYGLGSPRRSMYATIFPPPWRQLSGKGVRSLGS